MGNAGGKKTRTGCNGNKFWSRIWKQKEHNTKTEWINNLETELQESKEGSEADIYMESPRATLKKVPNGKNITIGSIECEKADGFVL